MAATPDNILTVAEAKTQLRLPSAHISENALIQSLINQAIDIVAEDTGRPLLNTEWTVYAEIPGDDREPIKVEAQDFVFDKTNDEHEIDYWSDKGDINEDPNASIARAAVGRTIAAADGRSYLIYVTDGESWPDDVRPGTKARIKGSRTYEVPDGLVSAVIVLVRFLYSGNMDWPSNPAYNKLIMPYRRLTPEV